MKKYQIKTYGCKLNRADSDKLRKGVDQFLIHSSEEEADLIIVNSCGVIDKTERKIIKNIKELKKRGKKVIVLGCLPYMTEKLSQTADKVIKGNDPEMLKKALTEMGVEEDKEIKKYSVKGKTTKIISIAEGCLGNCTYCGARLARGELKSYPRGEIIKEIKKALQNDVREIQLTSQDLGVYGMDRGKNELIDLLVDLISLEERFKIKLGMMNPGFIKPFFDDLLAICSTDKLYNFLHLPIQSGSQKVLDAMRRKHTVSDFITLAKKIEKSEKDFLLATDIIVGYPTETEEDFQKSLDLIKEIKPHIVNITRYSERKGTEAAKLKDMPSKIKKERSRKLSKLTKKIRVEDNQKMVGKKESVLLVKRGKKETFLGRTASGRAVVVKDGTLGKMEKIKIVDFKHNYLIGKHV